jgi:hypothetical protein
MFSRNRVQAAPLQVNREHLSLAEPQAVVVNSGVANAATGERGKLNALATAAEAARLLALKSEQVLVLSTGVIGVHLPMDKLLPGLKPAVEALSPDGGADAARAIMTTDTRPKEASASRGGFTVGGMAKGAGMIHPNLATMLGFLTTDYPLEPGGRRLPPVRRAHLHAISIDCSTNTPSSCSRTARAACGAPRRWTRPSRRPCTRFAPSFPRDRGDGEATVLAEIIVRSGQPGGGEGHRPADRDVPARQDRARPGPELGWCSWPPLRSVTAAMPAWTRIGSPCCSPDPRLAHGSCRRSAVTGWPFAEHRADRSGDGAASYLTSDLSYDYVHQRGIQREPPILKIAARSPTSAVALRTIRGRRPRRCRRPRRRPADLARMRERGLDAFRRRRRDSAALEAVRESLAEVNAALCAAIGSRAAGLRVTRSASKRSRFQSSARRRPS